VSGTPPPNWLSTPEAARQLGIHENTLKKKRDTHGGYLVSGRDYRFATDSPRSKILWNVESIKEQFHKRSVVARNQVRQQGGGNER